MVTINVTGGSSGNTGGPNQPGNTGSNNLQQLLLKALTANTTMMQQLQTMFATQSRANVPGMGQFGTIPGVSAKTAGSNASAQAAVQIATAAAKVAAAAALAAMQANANAANRPGAAGGGLGGGGAGRRGAGGGAGGAGGGFFGPGIHPSNFGSFRGVASMGATMAGGVEAGLVAQAVMEAGKLALEIPKIPALIQSFGYNLRKPALDFREQTYRLSRAGGVAGEHVTDQFLFDEANKKKLEALGLTREEAFDSLKSYGITPRGDSAFNTAIGLKERSLSAPFSDMDPGLVAQMSGQAVNLGMTPNQPGSSAFFEKFKGMLTDATQAGVDKSKLTTSFMGTMDSMARNGAMSLTGNGMMDYFSRMMATGTAAGKSSEAAAQNAQTMQEAISQTGKSSLGMISFALADKKLGIGGEKGFSRFVGKDEYAKMQENPATRKMLQEYYSLQGNPGMQAVYFGQNVAPMLLPKQIHDFYTPATKYMGLGSSDAVQTLVRQGLSHEIYASQYAHDNIKGGTGRAQGGSEVFEEGAAAKVATEGKIIEAANRFIGIIHKDTEEIEKHADAMKKLNTEMDKFYREHPNLIPLRPHSAPMPN